MAATNIAKWDGASWSPLGAGLSHPDSFHYVSALASHGGCLYASVVFSAGQFAEPTQPTMLYRWDGSSWTSVGSSTDGTISALAVSGNTLYVGGEFTLAGGKASGNVAKVFLEGVPPLEKIGTRATAHFRDIISGSYRIERAVELDVWEPLATRYAKESGGIDFTDENAPPSSAFYRAVPLDAQ